MVRAEAMCTWPKGSVRVASHVASADTRREIVDKTRSTGLQAAESE